MSRSLHERVQQVQTAASRLIWLHGLCRFVATSVAVVVALGLLDYLLRLHDASARWLLSAGAAVAVVWALIKLAIPAFAFRQNSVAVARRIELRFPQLKERLSSAMAFLAQSEGDPTAGSAGLRRAVVAEAEALAVGLDFRSALDIRAPRRAALIAATAFAIAGLFAALNPHAASLALSRLAMPWRDQPWPRRHELALVSPPTRVATGDDVEIAVEDRRGTLPDSVQLQLRYETGGGWRTETKEMKPLGERMIFRQSNLTHGFAYRARGGDDDTMPWTELAVVEPPKIVELQVLVQPPAYTGLPQQSEGRVVKALVGSQLRIRGRLDKPIRSAAARSQTPEFLLPAAEVAADGLSFTAPATKAQWSIARSGTFWFELADEHGMSFGRDTRVELHAAQDSSPSIAWETPADHTFVTARAIVPVKGIVKDDLAVRSIQLRYLSPGKSDEEQIVELYVGQASSLPDGRATKNRGFEGETRPLNYGWDLSRLAGLAPGDVLAARITAEDFQPQLATTVARRLTIITDEELEGRVTSRQGAILGQLAEALRSARQCRDQTQALEIRLPESGRLQAGDLNHLQSIQHNQRQVQRLLGNTPEGVEGQIVSLLQELAVNRAESQAIGQRLNELLAGVQELNRRPLPAIDQELTEAFKAAHERVDAAAAARSPRPEGPDAATTAVVQRLHTAGAGQDEVIQSLEKMLGTLTEWDNFSRLAREVGQIRTDEQRLADATDELHRKAIAAAAELAPPDRATARQLGPQQLELARRLDKLQSRMEEMLVRLQATDPLAAGTLADALDAARRLAIGGQMREAASRLTQLQFGQARAVEQVALDGLMQLLDTLSARRDYELARTVASLREASAELSGLLQRTAHVQAELDAAATNTSAQQRGRELARLQRELEQLSKQVEQLSRRLQRLQAPRAAASLNRAAANNAAAAEAAGGGNPAEAQQQAEGARQRLEEASGQLRQAIAAAQDELAREQLARIEQLVAGLVARQKNALSETRRLEAARDDAGRLENAQQAALRDLASEQRLLAVETDQLQPRLAAAEAFRFALSGAADAMRRAGALLARGQTAAATQDAEQAAVTRLEQILDAFRPDEPIAGASSQSPDQEQQPMPPPRNEDLSGLTAELKLLTLLQQEINRRTAELEAIRSQAGALTADQQQQLDALASEQGRLADMVLGLIRASAERPEDNLELELM